MKKIIATEGLPYTETGQPWPPLKPKESLTESIKVVVQGEFQTEMSWGPEVRHADGTSITQGYSQGKTVVAVKHLWNP